MVEHLPNTLVLSGIILFHGVRSSARVQGGLELQISCEEVVIESYQWFYFGET